MNSTWMLISLPKTFHLKQHNILPTLIFTFVELDTNDPSTQVQSQHVSSIVERFCKFRPSLANSKQTFVSLFEPKELIQELKKLLKTVATLPWNNDPKDMFPTSSTSLDLLLLFLAKKFPLFGHVAGKLTPVDLMKQATFLLTRLSCHLSLYNPPKRTKSSFG